MKPLNKIAISLAGWAVLLSIILSACGTAATPSPTQDPSIFYTQAAATIVLGLTETSAAMPPSVTPEPSPTITPQPSPSAASTSAPEAPASSPAPASGQQGAAASPTAVPVDPAAAHGCYNASFVADVTVRYAPTYEPGERFTKTWRVKNTGSCDWPRGIQIIFISGDRFGTDSKAIDQRVLTGATADISLDMIAPELGGVVTSNWQLANELGKPFGPVLSVSITLPASANSTASSGGCLNSALISDVTVPTGTILQTGEAFTKTWSVKNTGTCEWNRDFKITFVGGDLLNADTTKIRQVVGPGASTEISLEMNAPGTTGTISSAWQMASDSGQLFGQLFAFSIVVK